MVPNHTSTAAPILLGIAGQIALKSAANASATVIAQFLNPLMIIGLHNLIFAALCYILALKKIPVSVAFPSGVAASYASSPCSRISFGTSPSASPRWLAL
jgi:small multidrug resistance pump